MVEISGEALAQLKKSIMETRRVLEENHEYLRGNETRTRSLVIDEILVALGWNSKDPEHVWLEHRANGNQMDYVLRSPSEQFVAVVEAKPADSGPKDADRRQASGYATELGARYAVLTTGGRWEAWEMVPQKPRRDCILVEVHLTTGDVAEVAATLGKLHRDVLRDWGR